jgi:hypothetical protein
MRIRCDRANSIANVHCGRRSRRLANESQGYSWESWAAGCEKSDQELVLRPGNTALREPVPGSYKSHLHSVFESAL